MDGIAPALNLPALLTASASLLEVGELPQMVDGVEVADLDEPSTDTLHDLSSGLETTAPVSLPLEQVAGVKSVRSELKDTSELSGWGRGPEGELLHQ